MNTFRPEHEQHPECLEIRTVGIWLKTAREKNGITLDEVARVTRIGKNYLEAIEEGDLGKLPSQAYTRGFIRLYAAHLGLPSETALALMAAGQTASAEMPGEISSPPAQKRRRLPASWRPLAAVIMLTIALAAGFLLIKPARKPLSPQENSTQTTPPAEQVQKAVTAQKLQGEPPSSEPSRPLPPQEESGVGQGIILRLKAVSDGKIHITIDGSVSQEYDLVSGDLVEWKAEKRIALDLDDAASVEGELDGVKLAPFGDPGKAAHLTLDAGGMHKE